MMGVALQPGVRNAHCLSPREGVQSGDPLVPVQLPANCRWQPGGVQGQMAKMQTRGAVTGLSVLALLLFHLNLIVRGQTTYESIERVGNLYSDGCRQNCYNAWLRPIPAPYVDFSQPIEDAERSEPPEIVKMCNPPWADADSDGPLQGP